MGLVWCEKYIFSGNLKLMCKFKQQVISTLHKTKRAVRISLMLPLICSNHGQHNDHHKVVKMMMIIIIMTIQLTIIIIVPRATKSYKSSSCRKCMSSWTQMCWWGDNSFNTGIWRVQRTNVETCVLWYRLQLSRLAITYMQFDSILWDAWQH